MWIQGRRGNSLVDHRGEKELGCESKGGKGPSMWIPGSGGNSMWITWNIGSSRIWFLVMEGTLARGSQREEANEGPVRIQYKCLVHIYVFSEMKLLFSKQNYNVLSPIVPIHSYIFERFIYFQDRAAYSAAGKYVDRSREYINPSQTHKCGNWD